MPLAAVGVLAIVEDEAEAGAFAGVWAEVCAKSETPASAIVMVSPMIVLFIVVFLWKRLFFSLLFL